ncbi:hypothetical protein [Mycolicibacterium porcinum]|uniref:hypothetical protein n=1 Tax=Mycolicibacterium porcinum TaxID=39693 RepID=UPI0008491F4D|nr:hypothetical protein [Mycolicibacterium porcinum]ODR25817.1 hypothetical protein BHQ19_10320 [Mycolicibacterium porcinum]
MNQDVPKVMTREFLRKWMVDGYFFFEHLDCAVGRDCGHRIHADNKLDELMAVIEQYGNQRELEALQTAATIRKGENASAEVIARHVTDRIAELKQQKEGKE